MADFQSNECITSLYSAIYVHTMRSKKNHDLAFLLLLSSVDQTYHDSVISSDARLHINTLHFLVCSAVCSQMSCTSCLSNDDIQTPDQVSVPCAMPCPLDTHRFHPHPPPANHHDSVISSDARLHINTLHFLVCSAVCSQMSCTSCLSNDDIQTPDQVSVPCAMPCPLDTHRFHPHPPPANHTHRLHTLPLATPPPAHHTH